MFTGIIEDVGVVAALARQGPVVKLTVDTRLDLSDTRCGDSIAIDGVCLTVTALREGQVQFDVGPESLQVTALSSLRPKSPVHLERAMALGGRLGGHLVQGHADGVGQVRSVQRAGETLKLWIDVDPTILRLCVHKGSITLSGVSLTINALDTRGLSVWLIPHTLERTKLGSLQPGDPVNVEADLIAKYVERLLFDRPAATRDDATWAALVKAGFVSGNGGPL